jgi:hypothetical protein
MLERATRGEPVAITKHAVTKAYPISADQYHALRQEPEQKLFWRMYVAILRIYTVISRVFAAIAYTAQNGADGRNPRKCSNRIPRAPHCFVPTDAPKFDRA